MNVSRLLRRPTSVLSAATRLGDLKHARREMFGLSVLMKNCPRLEPSMAAMTRQWTHAVAQWPHFALVVALAFRLQETQVAELWFANRRLLDVSLSSAALCNVWVKTVCCCDRHKFAINDCR